MRIYMCDRCGKVYEKRKNCPVEDPADHTYLGIDIVVKDSFQYQDDMVRHESTLDLCTACQLEVFRWLKRGSIEVKDDEFCESR